jgi:gamma-glutamyltranspeptidase/glutathione hydrolase
MRDFGRPGRSAVVAENGMAATSHPLATATAVQALRSGGNAVDAAIAAAATLCVVEPAMTGIGGDCFVILAEPDGSVHGLNGSGRAQKGAYAGWYRDRGIKEMPQSGAHSVTVPGAVKAWEMLSERFGTRGFGELFADAIRYAEEGFAIHPRVARDWPRYLTELSADEGGSKHYLAGGEPPAVFSRFRTPALGQTLRAIADRGAAAFYEGEIGAEIAATVQAKGGFLSEEDLAEASADWVTPISTSYGGHDLLEIPPNGQGITALIMLNILNELGPTDGDPSSAARYHQLIETGRLAYSMRNNFVGDPATMSATVSQLLSAEVARELAAQFDPATRNREIRLPRLSSSDTIYLTVVDRDRRAVSFINSLYGGFGSKVVTPKSGITLQNRGGCFTLEEGHPNELGPGKRPLHTIIPAMTMKAGRPTCSFGVMGGAYQPMGHVHVLTNMLDFGMDPQEAADHARLFWGEDGTLEAEPGIGSALRSQLEGLGHEVRDAELPFGGAQVIAIDHDSGFLIGGSDPRKDGLALGW